MFEVWSNADVYTVPEYSNMFWNQKEVELLKTPPSVYVPYNSRILEVCSIDTKNFLMTTKSYVISCSLKMLNLRAIDKFQVSIIVFQRCDTKLRFQKYSEAVRKSNICIQTTSGNSIFYIINHFNSKCKNKFKSYFKSFSTYTTLLI